MNVATASTPALFSLTASTLLVRTTVAVQLDTTATTETVLTSMSAPLERIAAHLMQNVKTFRVLLVANANQVSREMGMTVTTEMNVVHAPAPVTKKRSVSIILAVTTVSAKKGSLETGMNALT